MGSSNLSAFNRKLGSNALHNSKFITEYKMNTSRGSFSFFLDYDSKYWERKIRHPNCRYIEIQIIWKRKRRPIFRRVRKMKEQFLIRIDLNLWKHFTWVIFHSSRSKSLPYSLLGRLPNNNFHQINFFYEFGFDRIDDSYGLLVKFQTIWGMEIVDLLKEHRIRYLDLDWIRRRVGHCHKDYPKLNSS